MKRKRMVSLLMTAVLTVGMCLGMAGCGAKGEADVKDSAAAAPAEKEQPQEEAAAPEEGVDTSEEVVLTMYLLGDRTPDFDAVFDKINEKLKKEINAVLDVKFMSWSEYEQKYPLVFASGEDWDIIFSADWAFYNAQATKQGFWEVTKEALEKYAPMTAETMYEEAWEQSKVNGKAYMLPMNYKEITSYVYIARGDLMDKYNITSVSSLDEVETYLDAIAKNEKSMIPLDIGSDFDALFMFDRMWRQATEGKVENIGPWQAMAGVNTDGSEEVVRCLTEFPELTEVITRLKDWKDRGFWSKSAAVNTQNNKESFAAGKSALALMNVNNAKSEYANISAQHPEWDIRIFDAEGNAKSIVNSYLANGMCIFSKSKHPERALMALDYLRNDEECHDLFSYGIEGTHWEPVGEEHLKSLEESANYPYDGNCNWGIRNDAYWRTIDGGIPGLEEMTKHWEDNAKSLKYSTFVFNDENVKNEIAAITEIFGTDYKLLCLGFTDDPEKDIEKMREKMKAAGADKVYAEMQKQAEQYMAGK
ncbi:ABC transporter substrate-binding protein [Diplocloster modestus]|uniref:ABC transporter substrate-binding protein n=1 Tax=Diplocloster modestus TaxID=2850322 RepID=A0ABS6K4Q1_9FIRM|nr:ABC transporter substrate-binding protein [Diplocloster modestus]MBU9725460.1 ABC transporter substrate-binding protein [Diplocloster modestus]